MKILIVSQYYPPEIGACANRISYMAEFLAKAGYDVTVLTAAPNYPDGIIYEGYKNQLKKEKIGGVNIIRVPVFLSKKKTISGRLAYYLSFMMNCKKQLRNIAKTHIIWATSPPLFTVLVGMYFKKKWRTPLVLDIRDIWPASIKSVEAVKNKLLLKIAQRIADKAYLNADALTSTSMGIKNALPEKIQLKTTVISNGLDEKLFEHHTYKNPLPPELHEKFIVLYTGNIGLAQRIETIIETAEVLKESKNIHFVIIGSGVCTDEIKKMVEEKKLSNVSLLGTKPHEKMPAYISHSNICLIPYKSNQTFRETIPSKLFEYMAGSKPVIINLEGEAADIIKKAKCGFVAKDEDPKDLAKFIEYFANDPEIGEQMGKAGRSYALQHFKRSEISKKLEEVLKAVCTK